MITEHLVDVQISVKYQRCIGISAQLHAGVLLMLLHEKLRLVHASR